MLPLELKMHLILKEAIVVLCTSCTFLGVLSVKGSYPPKVGTEEKCYLANVSSQESTCSIRRQPFFKRKLVRINGKEVGHARQVHLVAGETHKIITRALKPPVFEIPNFLTKEECQHIIQKAKETGLELSEVESPEEQDKFASSCYDDDYRCVRWAKYGECEKNPGYMLKNCQQSCEVCEDGRVLDFDDLDHDEDGILTGYEFSKATEKLFFMYLDEQDIQEMQVFDNNSRYMQYLKSDRINGA
ncbi:uncharacterized protein LOC111322197 [Stylophora pistillata]|uniref:uncharacterized protein LOC111322197 n=1 Tax=Stylophora pistillata TaxID=50429 RepID=UPI000C03CC52|nr:uncharacterized protein LOC111322197 [Stylophora pistillata]